MKLYTELPVFKAAYDLLLNVFKSCQHMKREYRYTLGEELKKEMMALMMCVYRANVVLSDGDKIPHLREARERIEVVKLQIRLLCDLKNLRGFSSCCYGKNVTF